MLLPCFALRDGLMLRVLKMRQQFAVYFNNQFVQAAKKPPSPGRVGMEAFQPGP